MRKTLCGMLLVAVISGGCDRSMRQNGVQLPTGHAADALHDWHELSRFAAGTHLIVRADPSDLIDGRLADVSDTAITLRRSDGPQAIDRASVQLVVRVEAMSGIRAKQGFIAGLVVGAFAFASGARGSFALALGLNETGLLTAAGAASGVGESRQTLVYERSASVGRTTDAGGY